MATIKDLAEQYGVAKAQDQNENLGRLAEMLGSARDIGNEYKVPSWVPLAGGTGAGDLLMGRTPEEIENWSYGNAPMQIPEMSNVPQFKRGRAQSLADALTTLAPGVKATEDLPVGMAIKGYHGSPHKFKEFDTAHMGTGEGGQAYGWGNYITEDPYVATTYSPQDDWMDEQLMNLYNQAERRQDYPSMEVYERYMMHERPNEVKDYLKESYADYPEDLPKRLPAQKIGENLYKKQKGSHLYEVSMEFPKEREAVDPMSIEHFLDYDKPLSEQSDYVRNILQSHDPDMYHPEGPDYDPAEKGNSILQRFGSGKEGAQKLYELGIPGTTYMGEKAKVANPEGVRNFVTYSDEVPRVVTRNMNKVKPLTDEDRLNDLEKQMSAYMKTKRMPKGVDFKTESDWYDWAYDKRDALRQKVSNEKNPPVIPVSNNKNYDLIKKYLSEGKLSPDDMAQYEQNALAMETPLLQRYNVENAEMQIPNTKQRAKSLGFMMQPSKEQYHLTRNDWENNIPDLTKSDLGFHTGSIDQANYRGKAFDDNAVGQSVIPIAPHKYTNYLKLNDLGSFHADSIAPQLEKKKILAKGKAKQIQSAIDNDWKLTDQYDQQMRDVLSQHDIDAIKYANEQEGEGLSYAHINPSMIRSRFAAFDPLRKNSSSIMASGLLGDLALKYANDEDQGYAQGGSVDKDSLQLNKPQRTPSHPDKSHIVKTMVDGKEKIIRFGEQGAETAGKPKEGESDRMTAKRESFKARHAKNIAKGPSSAAYWANKVKWAEGGEVDIRDDEGYADDLARLKRAYENSNFGPNDSMIASTIRHPIEAAKRYGQHLNDMYAIATDQLTDAELAAAKDAGYDEESYPLYAMEHPIFRTDAQKAEAGMEFAGLAQTGAMPFAPESAGGTLGTLHKFRIGDLGYDLRFDDRKLEQDKLQNMVLQLSRPENEKRIISLANYEGYPWVTSMSDRTNVGNLHYINDRPVDVDLQGGQDYMFNNPGQVWASAQAPVNAIMKYGKELSERAGGLDPLYMPWRMAPTGGDYANMTGETMLKYMRSNMNKKEQRAVNKGIKDFIPDFKGIESEEGIDQFRNAPDKVRKALKNHLDTKYRNAGGISIGEARLAVADPSQLLAPDTGLQNVGQIYTGRPIIQDSGHRAYPKGVPGQGLGVLDRDVMAYDLMPDVAEYRGLIDLKNPRTNDIRALQMKPYGGIITDKILKNLGYAKGGEVKDLHSKYEESDYGYGNRPDKTKKGLGYFGELERPDGTGVMTEYSIGVPINGEEMDVPTLVPTLTPDEIRLILHMQEGDDMPRSIVHKAIDHAHQRLSEGKPIFATEEDLYAHGGIVDVLHNDAIEQIMKAFMDSMADDEPAVSIEITTQNTETPRRGKIPKSIAREAKHG